MIIEIFADGLDREHINQENLHISCRGVFVKDGKILGEYLKKNDVFNLPGGGLEEGETLEQCCVREVAEETGVRVKVLEPTCIIKEYFPGETWESHFFKVEDGGRPVAKRKLTPEEETACLTAKWYDLFEFLEYLETYQSKNPHGANIHQREMIGLLNSI
jgi:8-oxo-dGTP diphosphatase